MRPSPATALMRGLLAPLSASPGAAAGTARDLAAFAIAVGAVAAGVVLIETLVVPVIVVGGAAALAPRYVPRLRRRSKHMFEPLVRRATPPAAAPRPGSNAIAPAAAAGGFAVKQALVKTITFRIIVTTLDFTTNYVVIGELATAAGLSAFSLVVGPVFYFVHEAAWNRYGPVETGEDGLPIATIHIGASSPAERDAKSPAGDGRGLTMNRALAKTITFRTIASTMDFATNYVVVGDLATAALLSASGFILGPFVYFGHEWAWDYFGSRAAPVLDMSQKSGSWALAANPRS